MGGGCVIFFEDVWLIFEGGNMTVFALNMNEAKERLSHLGWYMSGVSDALSAYAEYLSGRLVKDAELLPEEFILECELAIMDLKKGRDPFTDRRIDNTLCGCPDMVFAIVWREIPKIVDVIFPADYAEEVKSILRELSER